ncbi:unnamed protein product [Adineta ricciae]|uniref:Uncharacterized protein n=1 Tax=Adineta ricciae TaxID=249248 RepID=A0A815X7B2_ADIRI|nr:unnamed protein product [Adineta ricciae]CAF1679189.1 unnamed protein product [Adineta ricciae]
MAMLIDDEIVLLPLHSERLAKTEAQRQRQWRQNQRKHRLNDELSRLPVTPYFTLDTETDCHTLAPALIQIEFVPVDDDEDEQQCAGHIPSFKEAPRLGRWTTGTGQGCRPPCVPIGRHRLAPVDLRARSLEGLVQRPPSAQRRLSDGIHRPCGGRSSLHVCAPTL